jgi:hypothetical protein
MAMSDGAIGEETHIRDQTSWKSTFLSSVPLIFWLAVCFYSWSINTLDGFQVTLAIFVLAAFVYYYIADTVSCVILTERGVVIRWWRRKSVAWREITDFEVKSCFMRGRSLYVVLKDGTSVRMPAPTPGNPRYKENLQCLLDWKMAHGDSESERSQAEE